uniref:Uncharacterized protein n=1 Tax=Anopheles arabiensis TaxID=7173 RepID=A0A182IF14_ANOAR
LLLLLLNRDEVKLYFWHKKGHRLSKCLELRLVWDYITPLKCKHMLSYEVSSQNSKKSFA